MVLHDRRAGDASIARAGTYQLPDEDACDAVLAGLESRTA